MRCVQWRPKNVKTRMNAGFMRVGHWRSGWDSNPRYVAVHLISSQGRYDHFDTAPWQRAHYTIRPPIWQPPA